jgi:hypothetical protein
MINYGTKNSEGRFTENWKIFYWLNLINSLLISAKPKRILLNILSLTKIIPYLVLMVKTYYSLTQKFLLWPLFEPVNPQKWSINIFYNSKLKTRPLISFLLNSSYYSLLRLTKTFQVDDKTLILLNLQRKIRKSSGPNSEIYDKCYRSLAFFVNFTNQVKSRTNCKRIQALYWSSYHCVP